MSTKVQYYSHGRLQVHGGVLPNAVTAYCTYGKPENPCIVMTTYYSGRLKDLEALIGEDKAMTLDPRKYFIVTFALFSNGESSSPSNTVTSFRLFEMKDALNMSLSQAAPYNGPYFPTVSYEDNVRAQYATLVDALGVWEVFCAIGFSMGGQQVSLDSGNETCFRDIDATSEAYHWAVIFPEVVKKFVCICGSARTSIHNACFIEGPKAALLASKDFENGHYKAPPEIGIRAFGRVYSGWAYGQEWYRNKQHLYDGTYADLNTFIRENWEMRFLDWDANDMLTLINTWQQGDVSIVRDGGDFEKCLGSIKAQGLIMPCKTDLYFPPEDNEAEVKLMKNARLVVIDSPCGHMAAVGTDPADTVFITQEVKAFLDGY